jgi:5-methylcytosine-specific restriction endonuclease McrA
VKKPGKVFNVRSFAIAVLRRASYRSPARSFCLRSARTARNTYTCAKCKKSFPRKEVQVDHIESVVPTTGWAGFDDFIARLFVPATGLQCLCKPCHSVKTKAENALRRANKKAQG